MHNQYFIPCMITTFRFTLKNFIQQWDRFYQYYKISEPTRCMENFGLIINKILK